MSAFRLTFSARAVCPVREREREREREAVN